MSLNDYTNESLLVFIKKPVSTAALYNLKYRPPSLDSSGLELVRSRWFCFHHAVSETFCLFVVVVSFHKCTRLIPPNKRNADLRPVQRTESQLFRISSFILPYYFKLENALGCRSYVCPLSDFISILLIIVIVNIVMCLRSS